MGTASRTQLKTLVSPSLSFVTCPDSTRDLTRENCNAVQRQSSSVAFFLLLLLLKCLSELYVCFVVDDALYFRMTKNRKWNYNFFLFLGSSLLLSLSKGKKGISSGSTFSLSLPLLLFLVT